MKANMERLFNQLDFLTYDTVVNQKEVNPLFFFSFPSIVSFRSKLKSSRAARRPWSRRRRGPHLSASINHSHPKKLADAPKVPSKSRRSAAPARLNAIDERLNKKLKVQLLDTLVDFVNT